MSARIAPTDDCAALAALHDDCFAARGERVWSAPEFADMLAVGGTLCLGAHDGPRLCGFCLTRQTVDEVELLSIGVNRAFRHKGIARHLLQQAIAHHQARGMARLFLEVAADNESALHLYRSFGFVEAGRRKRYYSRADGSYADALVLALSSDDAPDL